MSDVILHEAIEKGLTHYSVAPFTLTLFIKFTDYPAIW